jgi:type IV secretion system protein VirB3
MFAGVPLLPFLMTSFAFLIVAVWVGYLISGYVALLVALVYIPLVYWMRHETKKDDQRLRQMLMRARMRVRQRASRQQWGAISFSPVRFKKRK